MHSCKLFKDWQKAEEAVQSAERAWVKTAQVLRATSGARTFSQRELGVARLDHELRRKDLVKAEAVRDTAFGDYIADGHS
jgi:hypothetical protein